MSEDALCPNPHPFGVQYRLEGVTYDDTHPPVTKPRRLFCPWCDWAYLRTRDGCGGAKGTEGENAPQGSGEDEIGLSGATSEEIPK